MIMYEPQEKEIALSIYKYKHSCLGFWMCVIQLTLKKYLKQPKYIIDHELLSFFAYFSSQVLFLFSLHAWVLGQVFFFHRLTSHSDTLCATISTDITCLYYQRAIEKSLWFSSPVCSATSGFNRWELDQTLPMCSLERMYCCPTPAHHMWGSYDTESPNQIKYYIRLTVCLI